MPHFAWADSAACLSSNWAWGVQRIGMWWKASASCSLHTALFHPHILIYTSRLLPFFCHWHTGLVSKISTWTPVGQRKTHTCSKLRFDLMVYTLGSGIKTVVLAHRHIPASRRRDEATSANVSRCISMLTRPHILLCSVPIMLNLQRHLHGKFTNYWGAVIWVLTHAAYSPLSKGWHPDIEVTEDYLSTEGNHGIWHTQMALKKDIRDCLGLDPNPQQESKWPLSLSFVSPALAGVITSPQIWEWLEKQTCLTADKLHKMAKIFSTWEDVTNRDKVISKAIMNVYYSSENAH